MLAHQGAFVDHMLEVVEAERVDLVVVSGDVYDRALPQIDAVALADETFARLAASRARVVVTSGNHDSAQRLGFGSRLIDAAGVHLRTRADDAGTPVVIDDPDGPVAVYGLPYLDPTALMGPWQLPRRSHEAALAEAMRRVRADLAGRPAARSIVLAHAFVTGCRPSESERDIAVGGVSMVSASLFDDISYTALGHLHRPQSLSDTVRYSGSPLAYSFSEAGHGKGSWLVDLGADGSVSADFVNAPVPRPLARIRGTLEDLLVDPSLAEQEQAWVEATLTDDDRPREAMARLRRRFPHALVLAFEPTQPVASGLPLAVPRAAADLDLARAFVADLRGTPATPTEVALLERALDSCCDDDTDVLVESVG